MNNLKLEIKIEDSIAKLSLKDEGVVIGQKTLTISQGFDNMLIKALDNLLAKNRIDRLSFNSLNIQGKLMTGAVSIMIIRSIKNALGI